MELSPEERQRIYLEEKTRLEARKQLEDQTGTGRKKKGCLYWIGVALLAIFLISIFSAITSTSKKINMPMPKAATPISDILKLKVTNFSTDEYGYYTVLGTITNKGTKSYRFVLVEANFYDKKKNLTGNDTTYAAGTDYIIPGAKKTFKFMGQDPGNYNTVSVGLKSYRE